MVILYIFVGESNRQDMKKALFLFAITLCSIIGYAQKDVIPLNPSSEQNAEKKQNRTPILFKQKHITLQEEEALLRNWIKTIASDEFGGRKPMTPYEQKTINYMAGQMEEIGLEPLWGDSYFQPFKMLAATCTPVNGRFSLKGKKRAELLHKRDLMVWTAKATNKVYMPAAEFVFCGFGIDAPEFEWHDFEGVDVKGKIIIAMVNDPGFYDANLFRGKNMTYYGRWVYKFEQAKRLGAAGCLVLHNTAAAGYGWHVCVNGHEEGNLAIYNESTGNADELGVMGWLHEDGARKIFAAAGADYEASIEAAKKPGFKPFVLKANCKVDMNVEYKVQTTYNVGGKIAGTDLADEAVVFNAHWDHLGIGAPDERGDSIYNGAADNASAMAALLFVAKRSLGLPVRPRRTLIFLSVSSEEGGMFGSQYYCEHPAIPMNKTVACINFESVGPAELTHDVSVMGGGTNELDNYITEAALAQGRYIYFNYDNSNGWFYRSDHYNFVKKGVPALVIENGKDIVDPTRPNKYPYESIYHRPSDEYHDDWDLSGTIANINLMFSMGIRAANSPTPPRWY